jgi:hypothetical protein
MGYDPKNPMEGRITDLGPRYYGDFLPPGHQREQRQVALS